MAELKTVLEMYQSVLLKTEYYALSDLIGIMKETVI